jgi:hypothetical protein
MDNAHVAQHLPQPPNQVVAHRGRAVYLAGPDGLCGTAARESATTGPFVLPLGGEPAQSSRPYRRRKSAWHARDDVLSPRLLS